MTSSTLTASASPPRLHTAAWATLLVFVAALQLSIAASAILLTAVLACWAANAVMTGVRPAVPSFFWPLVAYTGWTLVSVAFSDQPMTSLVDAKEVLLFLVVPVVFQLARGARATTLATVIITVGAGTAVIGIVQYGILEYDQLGQRTRGSMGHYMTYAGLLMMVIGLAVARILFAARDRAWAALVLPALSVALALTLTRNAMLGACVGVGLLLILKDLRLLAAAPVIAAIALAFAPAQVTDRVYSTFDLQDPTNRDRLAMIRAGAGMVRDHPLTGVGPEMVERVYPRYRPSNAVNATNPHLHNVPLQIAAERGLPALALWLWFVVAVIADLIRRFARSETRVLAAAGLAAMASMLTAGLFEYNFGDSEFLMLLLVLVTLPAAAAAESAGEPSPATAASTDQPIVSAGTPPSPSTQR